MDRQNPRQYNNVLRIKRYSSVLGEIWAMLERQQVRVYQPWEECTRTRFEQVALDNLLQARVDWSNQGQDFQLYKGEMGLYCYYFNDVATFPGVNPYLASFYQGDLAPLHRVTEQVRANQQPFYQGPENQYNANQFNEFGENDENLSYGTDGYLRFFPRYDGYVPSPLPPWSPYYETISSSRSYESEPTSQYGTPVDAIHQGDLANAGGSATFGGAGAAINAHQHHSGEPVTPSGLGTPVRARRPDTPYPYDREHEDDHAHEPAAKEGQSSEVGKYDEMNVAPVLNQLNPQPSRKRALEEDHVHEPAAKKGKYSEVGNVDGTYVEPAYQSNPQPWR